MYTDAGFTDINLMWEIMSNMSPLSKYYLFKKTALNRMKPRLQSA
jgi:hypothetical protein